MQVLRMVGSLLGDCAMKERDESLSTEPMVDAKSASAALRLPYYWFADQAMRSRYRIPHYLLGGLVRYRMSELQAWAAQNATAMARGDSGDGEGEQ